MNTPEWLIPGLVGAAVGVVGFAAVGFAFAGWTTPRQADRMAQTMAADRVMAMMVPVCVERARADSGRAMHLATIGQATGTGRRDALMATGWATMPGNSSPDRALADACLTALDLPGR
jgi:hypothetical protein